MLLLATKRAASAAILSISLALVPGCGGRWQPATSHEVASTADPQLTYATALEVVSVRGYTVLAKDDAARTARLQARSNAKSFIELSVVPGQVKLSPSGALVRGHKVHKTLQSELSNLEFELEQRLSRSGSPAAAPPATPAPSAVAGAVPQAWSEPAYDPSVWGNGNFTCLPVRVPQDHQAALTLQLSNGEKADLLLSLAYAPELCRSPAQCKQSGGCPALGIGDTDRVNRLAGRLSRGEVGSQAILLDGGQAVANIELSKHGSIVQALSEIKR